ncbi:hypothetical protein [Sphingomonas sp. CROZ-RG-20F-R02-07]|uniref:hypothetical protein n=1 Tax=Sphingomonas sp. CROZ-RG-20F-R02-07 TaxID=2914832 RepID=UPI001F576643|nr:hypothetical protein [Sphingomonas sp. CROZ-RG-20F-R02-07]
MGAQNIQRTAATFAAPALPLLAAIWAVHQPEFVTLTKSVPHPPVALTIAIIIYFVVFGVICRREIPAIKIAGALWIISISASLYGSGFIYRTYCQNKIFDNRTTVYVRSIVIVQVARVVGRGGPGYYAKISPDGRDAMLEISKGLFDRWNRAAANSGIANKEFLPDCKISVTVQKAIGGAERIADRRLFTDRDVVSTC